MQIPLELDVHGTADTFGNCIVTAGPPTATESWFVGAIGCSATPGASGAVTLQVLVNGVFRLGSSAAQSDSAGGDPPIALQPGEQLTFEWSGMAAGTDCNAHLSGSRIV